VEQSKPSAVLANRRGRPAPHKGDFAALASLDRNPVGLSVRDGELVHAISAERGKNGKVWLTCQCAQSQAEGWCQHRIDLLCHRFASAQGTERDKAAFETIVSGTELAEAGQTADRSMRAFEECLRLFDRHRPEKIAGRDLGKFTDLVSDLAACSSELEDALGSLRRLLERN
jgi:hypothetical protein